MLWIIKTLVGHGEILMGFADPPGMNPLFTGLCSYNAQHIIKNLNSWEDRKKSRLSTTFPPTTQVIFI
jgi:hypothetical protein